MTVLVWIICIAVILALVLLDLGVFEREPRAIGIKEALAWTFMWVVLALAFNVLVYFLYANNLLGWSDIYVHRLTGEQAATQFLTGYLLEKSLSVDNVFVIAMIFTYLQVPLVQQRRVLFWGVLGAVVLRGVMIALGAALIWRFSWMACVFGAFIIVSAARMLVIRHDNINLHRNLLVRLARRRFRVTERYRNSEFASTVGEQKAITPLLLAMLLVVSTDVVFAIDSIPAIFAITRDPFLVFTSNVFAILGLRALYFSVAGLVDRFRYLKMSLVFVLAYIGVKMMLSNHYAIPNLVSLAVVAGLLSVGVLASTVAGASDTAKLASPLFDDLERLSTVTYRQAWRIVVLLIGSAVVLVGIAMIVLPGPAVLVIPLGLMILGVEFAWARRWLRKVRRTAQGVLRTNRAGNKAS
jgi:tellurite resistance protein TerC